MRGRSLIGAGVGVCVLTFGVLAASRTDLPPGSGRDLVYAYCQTCHDPQYLVDSAGIPREEWDAAIDNMRQYGLRIPADLRARILEYLATYLGPNPPPGAPKGPEQPTAASVDGATVYRETCIACHQESGQGVAGQFPPLAGNPDLFLRADYPIKVVLFGMEGEIEVEGKAYRSAMPPFGHLEDRQIAAVVNYVRGAWANATLDKAGMGKVDAAVVAAAREKAMTPNAVLAYRRALEKTAR
jgi:mono/diheme cytochrome c family protein